MMLSPRHVDAPRTSGRLHADHGVVTLEGAVLAPVIIFATMVIVQAAAYFMANTSATNAAQIAVESARVQGAADADGVTAGRRYLSGVSAMEDADLRVSRSATTVTATVTASAPSIVPLVPMPDVRAEINAPVERVTQP